MKVIKLPVKFFDPDTGQPVEVFVEQEQDFVSQTSYNPFDIILTQQKVRVFAEYVEEGEVISYKLSEITILVHSAIGTILVANPSEIGTVVNPATVGTSIPITVTLTDLNGTPIAGKTLHFYYPDVSLIDTQVTDTLGNAVFTYVVRAEDDGQRLSIAYLGD